MELLLQKGFPVDNRDNCNRTALHSTAFANSIEAMKLLLQYVWCRY